MARRDGLFPALAVVGVLALGACGPINEDKGIKAQESSEWDNTDLNPGSTQDAGSGVQLTQSVDTSTPPRPLNGAPLSDSASSAAAMMAGPNAVQKDSAQGGGNVGTTAGAPATQGAGTTPPAAAPQQP